MSLLFFLILFYLTLQYCIGFAIYQNESATSIHDAWGWCTGMTQRDGMGREEGSGWEHMYYEPFKSDLHVWHHRHDGHEFE